MEKYLNSMNQPNLPSLTFEDQIKTYQTYQRRKVEYLVAAEKGKNGEDLPDGYVISPQTSYIMTNLLKEVITSGTGQRAIALKRPSAGKTGTTNDNYDAWFVGYTPNLISAVWLGFDEGQSLGNHEEGGHTAVPIWLQFMQETLDGKPVVDFDIPSGLSFASIDPKTGKLANDKTPHPVTEVFKEGTQPTEVTNNSNRPNSSTDFFLNE